MITFDQVVSPLSIDVSDAVKLRIIPVVDFADDASICLCFVGNNCHRTVQPHTLNRLVQKGLGSLCIPSRGQTEINHLAVRIDSAPQVAPLAANADVCLVYVPIDAGPAQMFLSSLGQFRSEF